MSDWAWRAPALPRPTVSAAATKNGRNINNLLFFLGYGKLTAAKATGCSIPNSASLFFQAYILYFQARIACIPDRPTGENVPTLAAAPSILIDPRGKATCCVSPI